VIVFFVVVFVFSVVAVVFLWLRLYFFRL